MDAFDPKRRCDPLARKPDGASEMKVGDVVQFINKDHTSYSTLRAKSGLVVEVDKSLSYCRPYNQRHLGAKVVVVFDDQAPTAYTEYSLELVK